MSNDTMPAALEAIKEARRKVTFDPTINLGHVLTFVGFLGVMSTVYMNIDTRLTKQEIRSELIVREMDAERIRTADTIKEMKGDVREVRKGVERLLERRGTP